MESLKIPLSCRIGSLIRSDDDVEDKYDNDDDDNDDDGDDDYDD